MEMKAETTTGGPSLTAILVGILVCEAVGGVAGVLTQTSVQTWYPTLVKPGFTPPDWLFGPVWLVLYAMMGVAAARIWALGDGPTRRTALTIFGGHLVLNAGWSAVFFGLRQIDAGLVVIVCLWLSIVAVMRSFARIDRPATWLLVPYLVWVTYAAALNVGIALLN